MALGFRQFWLEQAFVGIAGVGIAVRTPDTHDKNVNLSPALAFNHSPVPSVMELENGHKMTLVSYKFCNEMKKNFIGLEAEYKFLS